MKRFLLCSLSVLGLEACDGPPAEESQQQFEDVCAPALDKLEHECSIVVDEETRAAVTCDEAQQCAAGCVEASSCEEIIVTLQGGINTFSACIDVCAGQPVRQPAPACVAAENKLVECGLIMTGVCTEQDTCFTDCVAAYSCAEINAMVAGAHSGFSNCMLRC